jgi:3'-phosphoadenosine 5'-phosphosulfate sulfotransferase (PAPS reductase)/FAD synthetase
MNLDTKVESAKELIRTVMVRAKNPAVMSSFGKDSMVVLHLIRSMGYQLPVIFHREPFFPRKYRFANKVIDEWDLSVYDFPPAHTEVQQKGTEFEIINHYPVGNRTCYLPTGIVDPGPDEVPLCGLQDVYLKSTGTYQYRWDFVFHGHKSSDMDPICGAVPLVSDVANNLHCANVAFPIRFFTDADVWEYSETYGVPVHHERYEKIDGAWRERVDKTDNPDYFPTCVACMRRDGGPVPCPKLNGLTVSNISSQLRWAQKLNLPYMGTS